MGAYYQYCTEGGHPRRSGRLGNQGAGRGGCRECRNKPLKLIMKGKGVVLKSGLKMIDWGIGELVCTQGV